MTQLIINRKQTEQKTFFTKALKINSFFLCVVLSFSLLTSTASALADGAMEIAQADGGPPPGVTAEGDSAEGSGSEDKGASAEGSASSDKNWRTKRKKLKKQATQKAQQQVKEEITKEKVAKKLGFDWPVESVTRPKEEIQKEVENIVQKRVDEKYPPKSREDFKQEAKKKIPLYKKGDKVSFVIRGGQGRASNIENETLRDKTSRRIHVNEHWILREDVPERVQARFYKNLNQQYRKEYVRDEMMKYQRLRRRLAEKVREEVAKEKFQKANYVLHEGPDEWVSKKEYVNRATEYYRNQRKQSLQAKLKKQLLRQNNFKKYEGEWMPSDRVRRLQAAKSDEGEGSPSGGEDSSEGSEQGSGGPPEGVEPR